MATCGVCGTEFDDRRFQVVLPGRAEAFDRVDCAVRRAAGAADAVYEPVSVAAAFAATAGAAAAPQAGGDETKPAHVASQEPELVSALARPLRGAKLPTALVVFWLAAVGVSAALVFLGPGSDGPEEATRAAAAGPRVSLAAEPRGVPAAFAVAPSSADDAWAARGHSPPKRGKRERSRPDAAILVSAPSSEGDAGPGGAAGGAAPTSPPPAPTPPPAGGGATPPAPSPVRPPSPPASPPPPPSPVRPPSPPPPPSAAPAPPPPATRPPAPLPTVVPPPAPPPPQESRPGNGHGDRNHVHTGPPGQTKGKGKGKP